MRKREEDKEGKRTGERVKLNRSRRKKEGSRREINTEIEKLKEKERQRSKRRRKKKVRK